MKSKILILLLALAFVASSSFADEKRVDGKKVETFKRITVDTIRGDSTNGLYIDSDRDGVTEATVTASGDITATSSFIIGSADINETDLEKLDGITNGTAVANKALVTDVNIDIDLGTGDMDVTNLVADGTSNLIGAVTIGTATSAAGNLSMYDAGTLTLYEDGDNFNVTLQCNSGEAVGTLTGGLDVSGVITSTSPVFTTPNLGTPSALVGTNISGTAANLTAGSVTNATLTTALTVDTGTVTLTGNVANSSVLTIGAGAVSVSGSNTGDNSGTDDQTLAEVLASGADGNDVDITSLGKLEFFDAGLYLDADADGVMNITSDNTLELHSADWDISTTGAITNAAIDADNNTVTNIVIGAECTGASTSLTDTADIFYDAELTAAAVEAALTNDAIDFGTGVVTAAGFTLAANENITLGAQTLDHDGTDFVFNDSVNAGANAIKSTVNMPGVPHHLIFNVANPNVRATADTQICIWPLTPAAFNIDKIEVTLDAAGNEVAGDLKYADTFIGLANPVLIETFDTTNGVRSDSSMSGTADVPASKCLYIQFDSVPNAAILQMSVDITFNYD